MGSCAYSTKQSREHLITNFSDNGVSEIALLLLAFTVSSLDGCGSKSSKDNNCSVESNCWAGEGDCDWDFECYSNSCVNNNCGGGYLANDDCCAFNNPCGAFDMV